MVSDWFLSSSAIKQAKETYEKILRQLVFWEGGVISNEKNNPINIRKSLLRGIFLQVAFHDNRPKDTYVNMSEQQPGLIAESSVMLDKKAPIIVFVTFSRTKRNYSLNVFAIEADWLFDAVHMEPAIRFINHLIKDSEKISLHENL